MTLAKKISVCRIRFIARIGWGFMENEYLKEPIVRISGLEAFNLAPEMQDPCLSPLQP